MNTFWNRVDKSGGPDACWPWMGSQYIRGHGQTKLNGQGMNASRKAMCLHLERTLDSDEWVLHSCPGGDNPLCCNPAHLRIGTRKDNEEDAKSRGQLSRQKGEQNGMSTLTDEQVICAMARMLAGESQASIAREYSVSKMTISSIWTGDRWSHLFALNGSI